MGNVCRCKCVYRSVAGLTHDVHEVDESEEHLVAQLVRRLRHAALRPVVVADARTPHLRRGHGFIGIWHKYKGTNITYLIFLVYLP